MGTSPASASDVPITINLLTFSGKRICLSLQSNIIG
jgi:hypothetical protein